MNENINTSVAPQTGPHSSQPTVETTYEIEIMQPYSKGWHKTDFIAAGRKPFTNPQDAWDAWFAVADNSDIWRSAQARLVQYDRKVMPSVCEPVEGWESYHRGVALIEADRATNR